MVALLGWVVLALWPQASFAQSRLQTQWIYHPITSAQAIAYSPDGAHFAVAGGSSIQIFTVASGQLFATIHSPFNITSIAFSPNGNSIAGGGNGVGIWSFPTGALIRTIGTSADVVPSVAFAPNGQTLATAGEVYSYITNSLIGEVELWAVSTGALIETLPAEAASSIAFSPDGTTLATAGGDSALGNGYPQLATWNVATASIITDFNSAATGLYAVAFSPDGKSIADGGDQYGGGGVLETWNVSTGGLESRLGTAVDVLSVAFSGDGQTLADVGGIPLGDGASVLEIWNAATGIEIASPEIFSTGQSGGLFAVAFSPDGKTVADAGQLPNRNGAAEFRDAKSGEVVSVVDTMATADVEAIAFSPDGKTLADGGLGLGPDGVPRGLLELRSATNGVPVRSLVTGATFGITAVAFSPDGRLLADGGYNGPNGVAEIWNASSGALFANLDTGNQYVTSVAFSRSGNLLAVGCESVNSNLNVVGTVELFNVENGKLMASIASLPESVAISPDDRLIAVADSSAVSVYSASNGQLLESIDAFGAEMAFSPDGDVLAVGGSNLTTGTYVGVLGLWNVATGTRIAVLPLVAGTSNVSSLAYSPDGKILFAATGQGYGSYGSAGNIQAFSTASNELLSYFNSDGETVGANTVAVSPNGGQLAFGAADGTLAVAANPFCNPISVTGITVSPASVQGGNAALGTITIVHPAPASGDVVALSSAGSALTLPSSVIVPAGATSTHFSIGTNPVTAAALDSIVASSGGENVTGTLALTTSTAALLRVSVSPTSIASGTAAIGTISLTAPAQAGGQSVSLASNLASVTIPSSVVVPAGATSVTFRVATNSVLTDVNAVLTAKMGILARTTSVSLVPAYLADLSLSTNTVVGGSAASVIGTVSLSGPAPAGGYLVLLGTTSAIAQVPNSVLVPAGKSFATFSVKDSVVPSSEGVNIVAQAAGVLLTKFLTLTPLQVTGLTIAPTSVVGGSSATATLTLSAAVGTPLAIQLASSSSSVVVRTTVTVAKGASSAVFTVNTAAVASTTSATITATLDESSGQTSLTVLPPTLLSLSVSPSTVQGSSSTAIAGLLTLSGPAPLGGLVISMSSSDALAATPPASVTILSGKTAATFVVKHTAVTSTASVTLTATLAGVVQTAVLVVTP